MRILCNYNNFCFKSNDRRIKANNKGETVIQSNPSQYINPEYGYLVYSNYTNFFRPDLNRCYYNQGYPDGTWNGFYNIIMNYFSDVDKVNVYDFACSDGSEPYSFALGLIDRLGEDKAQKYFPVYACDIDDEIIKIAKSGNIPILNDDVSRLNSNASNVETRKYYDIEYEENSSYPKAFVAKDGLKDKINFEKADIKNAVENIQPTNSLVLCRNFWKYMSTSDMYETIWKLSQKLDGSSLLVIGDFDKFVTWTPLTTCGFEEIHPLIFRKRC